MATWNMYVLITNARRLRALNQGISGSFIEAPNHTSIEAHEGCILQPSTSQVERLRGQGCVTPFSPVHQPSFDATLKRHSCTYVYHSAIARSTISKISVALSRQTDITLL
eukprot:scaffold242288_cov23-Cyclotella_meneghiniana.AAC.1